MLAPIIAALFGIGIAVGVFTLKHLRRKARTNELRQLAGLMGLPFEEKDALGLATQLQGFDLFKREASKWRRGGKITNLMTEHLGDTTLYLFDYSYIVSTGKSSKEVRQTVFFADSKQWSLPDFKLRPESWWHKLLGLVGARTDINFPENPDFSDKFWVTGAFESLVRQHFGPELQQFLCERPPVHMEGQNYYLIAYKPGKALPTAQAQTFFEHCRQLVEHLQKNGDKTLLDLAELLPPPTIKADMERLREE